MPARPGAAFQPVLPGLGRVARKAPSPVSPEPAPAWNDRRGYRGPQPGQLVMGVTDLAHQAVAPHRQFSLQKSYQDVGFHEVNEHGYVRELHGTQHNDAEAGDGAAYHYYGTHGGRYAKTMKESLGGESPSDMGLDSSDVSDHDRKVRDVKAHWSRQPTVQFPTDALVHTSQSIEETEGDATLRQTQRPLQEWTRRGGVYDQRPKLTAGGSPVIGTAYTENGPGQNDGRQRIERIKDDLRGGRQIRKPIWMMKVNGRHFQLDGHHRMVAAREAGVSHVPVKLWDLDAARSTPPPAHVLEHAVSTNPALAAHMHSNSTRGNMLAALRDLAER